MANIRYFSVGVSPESSTSASRLSSSFTRRSGPERPSSGSGTSREPPQMSFSTSWFHSRSPSQLTRTQKSLRISMCENPPSWCQEDLAKRLFGNIASEFWCNHMLGNLLHCWRARRRKKTQRKDVQNTNTMCCQEKKSHWLKDKRRRWFCQSQIWARDVRSPAYCIVKFTNLTE